MGCSGWLLLGTFVALTATKAGLLSARNCHQSAFHSSDFRVSCGYHNKQMEVAVTCNLENANWSRFPGESELGFREVSTSVGILKFVDCRVPENASLHDDVLVRSLNVSFVDSLHFENLRSSLSRQNLRGFSVRVFRIIGGAFRQLPSDVLHDVSDVEDLSIEETELTAIPAGFFGHWSSKTQNVSFMDNKLRQIAREDFTGLEKAQNLWLNDNEISDIELGAFDKLPNLRILDISSNRMRGMQPNLFRRLGSIEVIHLGFNRFDELPAELLTGIDNCHLTRFRMSYNQGSLRVLPAGFFRNLSTLTNVELLHNQFTALPRDLFAGATDLEYLNISRNNLTTLPPGIFNDCRKLVELRIDDNQLGDLPEGIFRGLTDLQGLYLNDNRLTNISSHILEGIDSLRILEAASNNISYIDNNFCEYVKTIQEINLSRNQLTLERAPGISVMVNCLFLRELIVSHNKISQMYFDWIASNLELIDLRYNLVTQFGAPQLHFLRSGITILLQNNKITTIDLKELEYDTEVYRSANADNSDKGIKVYLGGNPLNCDCQLIDFFLYFENKLNRNVKGYVEIYANFTESEREKISFTGSNCAAPKELAWRNIGFEGFNCAAPKELASRSITDINSEDLSCSVESREKDDACNNSCVCREYPRKQVLSVDCSNRNLVELPMSIANAKNWSIELNMSSNKLSLIRPLDSPYLLNVSSLDLFNNSISTVTTGIFLKNLRVLKLHNNSISQLEENVIKYLLEDTVLRNLTLHGNKWECNCQVSSFHSLFQRKVISHQEFEDITCAESDGTPRYLWTMTAKELCESTIETIIVGSLLVAFFGVAIGSLAALYYRYQREIKVWLYSHQRCLWLVTEDELDKDKKYDAFISFSHKDEDFVEKEIVAKLEEGPRPYKLCLHYRDWLAGEWIPLQISRSVEESRRTVVILSPNFLESIWGRMEFRAAHTQALKEGRTRLIVVLYDDIGNTNDLDPELKSYLSLNTYVKWGEPWFWDKLRYALPHRHELSTRRTRNARIVENHLVQLSASNDLAGKAEVIPMLKSIKLLDSTAEEERMTDSC